MHNPIFTFIIIIFNLTTLTFSASSNSNNVKRNQNIEQNNLKEFYEEIQNPFTECPQKEAPFSELEADKLEGTSSTENEIVEIVRLFYIKVLSTAGPIPSNWENSEKKMLLDHLAIQSHFTVLVEEAFTFVAKIKNDSNEEFRRMLAKLESEWTNFRVGHELNSNRAICRLQAFAHWMFRNSKMKIEEKWAELCQKVAKAIFKIDHVNTTKKGQKEIDLPDESPPLSEEEYREFKNNCDESAIANGVAENLLETEAIGKIHLHNLRALIIHSKVFQHFLCYHHDISMYKEWLYFIMGRANLDLLEQQYPIIMHIEKMSATMRLGLHHAQFLFHTGTAFAMTFECRVLISEVLDHPSLKEIETRLKTLISDKNNLVARKLLKKLYAIKTDALAPETIGDPKGVCMLVFLRRFLEYKLEEFKGIKSAADEGKAFMESIEVWWPGDCDRRQFAISVFQSQREALGEFNRKKRAEFMGIWQRLIRTNIRGGPARLWKFLQLSEREIELEYIYDGRYTNSDVFRSVNLLETHYLDAMTSQDPIHSECSKLAADLSVWVMWLEVEILKLSEDSKSAEFPRLAYAWKQNRWYFEVVYGRLFDIEKSVNGGAAELEKMYAQIQVLLEISKNFVDQKVQIPNEKLRTEMPKDKIKRLIKEGPREEPPPHGSLDRGWWGLRRIAEDPKNILRNANPEFEKWMNLKHFEMLQIMLRDCPKFKEKFIDAKFH